jgi:hypothetical protein
MGCNDRVRISTLLPNIRVAQLDRATAYEAVGWGLESLRGYQSINELCANVSMRIYIKQVI